MKAPWERTSRQRRRTVRPTTRAATIAAARLRTKRTATTSRTEPQTDASTIRFYGSSSSSGMRSRVAVGTPAVSAHALAPPNSPSKSSRKDCMVTASTP